LLIVSTLLHRWLTVVVSLSLLSVPAARLFAQSSGDAGAKPVLVVSIANSDELLGDISFLTEAAGAGDVGRLVALMAAPYTAGLEKGKPAGAYATLTGPEQMEAIGFFAVKDLKLLLGTLQDQLGQPQDVGDGVVALATDRPQPVYVKESDGWAFFTNKKDLLKDLPKNPAKILEDLPEQYTVAVRVNVANVPVELRDQAVQQMRKGFEESLEKQVQNEQQAEVARQLGESWLNSMISVVEEADHITLGWQIDAETKSTHLDINVTALRGTQLAKDMAQIRETTSAFAGMLHPDAAATFLASAPCSEADVKQGLALIGLLRTEAMKGIDKDEKLANDAERAKAKKIVGDLLDLAVETTEAATVDCGGCLVLKPEAMTAVVGGFISDGNKLAASVQELHAFAQAKDPKVPDVKFNAETHRDVTLHIASIPLPPNADANARKVLGNPMEIVIGTAKDSAYLAFGKNAKATMMEVLDASADQANRDVPPCQAYIALMPILQFASSVDDNPVITTLIDTLKAAEGKDRITFSVLPTKRGVSMRLAMDAGVMATIGEGVRALAPLMQNLRQN